MSLFQGMTFDFLLQTPEDLKKLNTIVDVTQELHYVMDAITLTRQRLEGRCPLIGFAGAPVSIYSIYLTFFFTWKFNSPWHIVLVFQFAMQVVVNHIHVHVLPNKMCWAWIYIYLLLVDHHEVHDRWVFFGPCPQVQALACGVPGGQ